MTRAVRSATVGIVLALAAGLAAAQAWPPQSTFAVPADMGSAWVKGVPLRGLQITLVTVQQGFVNVVGLGAWVLSAFAVLGGVRQRACPRTDQHSRPSRWQCR